MKVINSPGSYQQPPRKVPKKTGMKRDIPPYNPLKRKARGKEIKPGVSCTGLSARERVRVHVCDPWRRRCIAAAVEDALTCFCGTRGPAPSDEALWANFAWRFGYSWLLDLVERGKAEMAQHTEPVPISDRPRILQNLINAFWRK